MGTLILLVSLVLLMRGDSLQFLSSYGYPAIFIVSLISNAALFLPAPGIALVLAASTTLDPLLVGIIAGLGATLGELTGFLLGQGGQDFLSDNPLYWRFENWMKRSGMLVLFGLAVIPNPLFDIGGLVAGAMRMPAWRFLLSVWLGKSLRFGILATFGSVLI